MSTRRARRKLHRALSVYCPEELCERMDVYPYVNWSAVARFGIENILMLLEESKLPRDKLSLIVSALELSASKGGHRTNSEKEKALGEAGRKVLP